MDSDFPCEHRRHVNINNIEARTRMSHDTTDNHKQGDDGTWDTCHLRRRCETCVRWQEPENQKGYRWCRDLKMHTHYLFHCAKWRDS
jgi:hypothetical protein